MALSACAAFGVSATAEGATVALVIGSERYESERLPGAVGAADRLARRLEALGVDVTLLSDAPWSAFAPAEREFAARADGAHLAIIAYAGHAVRLGGSAFIVPREVSPKNRNDRKRLHPLPSLIDQAARADHSLVLLDTCHEARFSSNLAGSSLDIAPLCPGDEAGFERPSGTLLSWASDTPTPRGEARGVGRLLEEFAERLETSSASVPDALGDAAAGLSALVIGGGEQSWPLIDASAAPEPPQSESVATASVLPSGRYRIANLHGGRLGTRDGGDIALVGGEGAPVSDVWTLRSQDDGSLTLSIGSGGETLASVGERVTLSRGDARWRAVAVAGGLDNEFALREASGSAWLIGDVARERVVLDDAPGSTGWLLERLGDETPGEEPLARRPTGGDVGVERDDPPRKVRLTVETVPEDADVRITNIVPPYVPGIELWPNEIYQLEIRHPAHVRLEYEMTLGDQDRVLRVDLIENTIEDTLAPSALATGPEPTAPAAAPPSPAIDAGDRAAVIVRLEAVRDAVESRDMDRLAQLVPPGDRLDRLVALMDAYAEVDVEIGDLLGSDDGRRVSAVLRVVRLVDEFGDTVIPPPAFRDAPVYAEREGESRWSALRWDTGSG